MDHTPSKVINSYCCYYTAKTLIFLVFESANKGDIFKISRENLRECFLRDSDNPNIPEVDPGTKRVEVTFLRSIPVSDTREDDLLLFSFNSDASGDDTFLLHYSIVES